MVHSFTILKAENENLRIANKATNERKKRQKKRIQQQGSLTIQDGQDLINQLAVQAQIS